MRLPRDQLRNTLTFAIVFAYVLVFIFSIAGYFFTGHSQENKRLIWEGKSSLIDSNTLYKDGHKSQKPLICKQFMKFDEIKVVYKERETDGFKGTRITWFRYWLMLYTFLIFTAFTISELYRLNYNRNIELVLDHYKVSQVHSNGKDVWVIIILLLTSFVHVLFFFIYLFSRVQTFVEFKIVNMIYNVIIQLELKCNLVTVIALNSKYFIVKRLFRPSGTYIVWMYFFTVFTVLSHLESNHKYILNSLYYSYITVFILIKGGN